MITTIDSDITQTDNKKPQDTESIVAIRNVKMKHHLNNTYNNIVLYFFVIDALVLMLL